LLVLQMYQSLASYLAWRDQHADHWSGKRVHQVEIRDWSVTWPGEINMLTIGQVREYTR